MRKYFRLLMNKGRIIFVTALTAVVALTLALFVGHTISDVNYRSRQSCFDELADTTNRLAEELYSAISNDHTTLSAIAAIIAGQDALSDAALLKILNTYNFDTSYISFLQVLRPDGTMLYADGTIRDVSEYYDFAEEVRNGDCISHMEQNIRNPGENVIRHIVPIVRNGEVASILYGTVLLSDLSEQYTTSLYDGNCYVYIEDGDTGDFILDTWHKTQGNIIDMGERQIIDGGKSIANAIEDMRNGISGETGFISHTTGNVLYMRYAPLGINNWNVMLTVEEKYALAKSEYISNSLYAMAAVIGAVLLIYAACVVVCMFFAYLQVRKLGTEDQGTGVQNRNMYLWYLEKSQNKVFSQITCAYVDVNGLHRINNEKGHEAGDLLLRCVAKTMLDAFGFHMLYRIGGDEFVVFSETDNEESCTEKMKNVTEKLEEKGYSISYGIVCREGETGLGRIALEADREMLNNKEIFYSQHDRRSKAR